VKLPPGASGIANVKVVIELRADARFSGRRRSGSAPQLPEFPPRMNRFRYLLQVSQRFRILGLGQRDFRLDGSILIKKIVLQFMRNRQSTHIYTCSHPLSWVHLSQIILKPLRAAKKRQSKSVLVPKTERKFGCLLQNVLCNCDATHPTELSYHAAKSLSFLHLITFTSIMPWVVTTLKGARLRFLIHSPL